MLRRALVLGRRTNYYQKYGIPRNATDDEIKKKINSFTAQNSMNMGKSFGSPKKKLQVAVIFAARDQWAKFVLIKHRKSYDIYVDEKTPIKACVHAFSPKKQKIEIKVENTKNTEKSKISIADQLNEKLAAAQKEKWTKGTGQKNFDQILDEIKSENSQKKSTDEEKFKNDEKIIKTRIVEEEKFSLKSLIGFSVPAFLVFSKSPIGKRFLMPFLSICMIPAGFVFYYLFENNRKNLDSGPNSIYRTKSVMELREERKNKI